MDIVVDFKKDYSESRVFEDNELIHYPIMDQAMSVFGRLYDYSIKYSDNFDLDLPSVHNAISIFGSRGAGKSSFLYSMLERVKTQYKDALCLTPMDPSHVEMKQHPFVNVLASIHQAIDKEMTAHSKGFSSSFDIEMKQENLRLQKPVLKGLKMIDGIGKDNLYEEWNDDDYISRQGMELALDCNALENSFHQYVRQSLRMIGKKCIVIAFDDIDIDYKKGFEILEMIRKYLTSPQIIPIITGDQSLYTALVRKYQWQFFDQEYIRKETKYAKNHPSEFSSMVDHLENQYMAKVLKPENRITLLTIREYLNQRDVNIIVKGQSGKAVPLMVCYKDILKDLSVQSASLEELALFLSGLSLRTQIRILTLRKMSLLIKDSEKARKYLTSGLMSIFSTDIYQKSDNAKELISGKDIYTIELLRLLLHSGKIYTSCNFMPQTSDFILNKALLAVGIKFDEYLHHDTHLIFDYWVRVCYTKILSEKLGGKTDPEVLKELVAFGRMDTEISLCYSVGMSEAYFQGQSYRKGEMVMPGCVFIGNRVPVQLAEKNELLPLLPMHGIVGANNSEKVIVSIYRLLAVLAEFVCQINQHRGDDSWDAQTALVELGQFRKFIEPLSELRYLDDSERLVERPWDYLDDVSDSNKVGEFIEKTMKWATKGVLTSVQKINRVFTRFYYTIIQIEEQRYSNLGMKLNDIILSLLNAAIVEDALEMQIKEVNVNHVGDITQKFIHNWRVMQNGNNKSEKAHTLSRWILDCPLLQLFINPFLINLMEFDTKTNDYFSSIVQYDRWLMELERCKDDEKDVEQDLEKQIKQLYFINIFEHVKELRNQIDDSDKAKKSDKEASDVFEEEFNKISKLLKAIQASPYRKDVNAIKEQLETLFSDNDDELKELKNDVVVNIFHDIQRKQAIEENIKEIEHNIESVSSFVKSDYDLAKESHNTLSYYPLYCTIRLNDFE